VRRNEGAGLADRFLGNLLVPETLVPCTLERDLILEQPAKALETVIPRPCCISIATWVTLDKLALDPVAFPAVTSTAHGVSLLRRTPPTPAPSSPIRASSSFPRDAHHRPPTRLAGKSWFANR
jgi:hypothetical protein